MKSLNRYVAPLVAATAITGGCVIEKDSRTGGGSYDVSDVVSDRDAGADVIATDVRDRIDASDRDTSRPVDSGATDTGRDTAFDVPNPNTCLTVLPSDAQAIIDEFQERTGLVLTPITPLNQPVLQIATPYNPTGYAIHQVNATQGYLVRGGLDTVGDKVIVGVANYDDVAQKYTDRQFAETMYNGTTPFTTRVYIDYGQVVAGNSFDQEVLAARNEAGNCDVRFTDTRPNPDAQSVYTVCRMACDDLLQGVGNTSVYAFNQLPR